VSLPFTHVWAALVALKQLLATNQVPAGFGAQRDEFILGTLYPDSRYLTGAPRTQTHPANAASLSDVALWPHRPFQAGAVLHAFVDRLRLHYLREPRRALVVAKHKQLFEADTAWKVLEDVSAWALIPPGDLERVLVRLRRGQFGIQDAPESPGSAQQFAQWCGVLLRYLSAKPSDDTRLLLARDLKRPRPEGEQLNKSARILGSDKEALELVIDFFIELPVLLQLDLSSATANS
jgi:hypothetical protein